MKVPHLIAATLGIAAAAAAFGALAHEDPAGALAQAQIGLTQAVTVAEQHAHGRAVRAELESGNGAPVYGVEVFDGAQSVDVKVDARRSGRPGNLAAVPGSDSCPSPPT